MSCRSPYADVEIPSVPLSEFVLEHATARGDKPALIDGPSGRVLTYAAVAAGTKSVAAALQARGIGKGDVIAIFSPNLPEYALAFHGVAIAGGIVTTLNPTYTTEELAYQLRDSGARMLITVPPLLERASLASHGTAVTELVVFGEAEGAMPFASFVAHDGPLRPVPIDPARDVVALPYSSGTTGLNKGVMLTHRNLIANVVQMLGTGMDHSDEVLLAVLPFFHIYGMEVILNIGLRAGATTVTMPKFDLEQYLTLIERYRVTFAHVVPPIIIALAKHPLVDKFDLSSLRSVFSGAAPLGAAVSAACGSRLDAVMRQGYGMTETSPATHCTPHDPEKIKPGSVGVCLPNTECKILSLDTGKEVGRNHDGELVVRGPQVMLGYHHRPEATAEILSADGWLRTGDIGYADDDGNFFIVDRAKELIKYKGMQ
ncbi:MAG: AMP-binding protein, partial [Gemmatimonadota bacterium]|nr:AMP-binding protein [Gemmatimonadota bacterium]